VASDELRDPPIGDPSTEPWGSTYPLTNEDIRRGARWNWERRDELKRQIRGNWSTFPEVSGTHIRREPTGRKRQYDLVTGDDAVLATVQDRYPWPGGFMLRSVRVGEHSYRIRPEKIRLKTNLELVDIETGSVDLWVEGRHYGGKTDAVVHLSPQCWFRFPILGSSPTDEVMTAVDEMDRRVIRFRQSKTRSSQARSAAKIEVVVNPDHKVSTELLLVIAIASGFLLTEYTMRQG
jgi:hypothetical protein